MDTYYIAGFIPEEDGSGWSVYFPDVPNVAAGGETISEALTNARAGLSVALREMAERNLDIPAPSSMRDAVASVRLEREEDGLPFPDESVFQYVLAPEVDTTPVRVNISIPRNALNALDRKAEAAGTTRSGYIARIAMA